MALHLFVFVVLEAFVSVAGGKKLKKLRSYSTLFGHKLYCCCGFNEVIVNVTPS